MLCLYKKFDNLDQENKCFMKHPVCKSCLAKWIFLLDNNTCPVCKSRVRYEEIENLQESRYYKAGYWECCF